MDGRFRRWALPYRLSISKCSEHRGRSCRWLFPWSISYSRQWGSLPTVLKSHLTAVSPGWVLNLGCLFLPDGVTRCRTNNRQGHVVTLDMEVTQQAKMSGLPKRKWHYSQRHWCWFWARMWSSGKEYLRMVWGTHTIPKNTEEKSN